MYDVPDLTFAYFQTIQLRFGRYLCHSWRSQHRCEFTLNKKERKKERKKFIGRKKERKKE
jgi:hypothetical protein